MKEDKTIVKVLRVIGAIALTLIVIGAVNGGFAAYRNNSVDFEFKGDTTQSRESMQRIAKKVCVTEATKQDTGYSTAQMNSYCQCAIDQMYSGTVAEMQKFDRDVETNGFTPKQEQIMLDCIESII